VTHAVSNHPPLPVMLIFPAGGIELDDEELEDDELDEELEELELLELDEELDVAGVAYADLI